METADLEELTREVSLELERRNYGQAYILEAIAFWERLKRWCSEVQRRHFSKAIGYRYLDEVLGFHILPCRNISVYKKKHLRAVKMLVSFMEEGCFEFRSPRVEPKYNEELTPWVIGFLDASKERGSSRSTLEGRRRMLLRFSGFMDSEGLELVRLDVVRMEKFFLSLPLSGSTVNDYRSVMKKFFDFLFEQGAIGKNLRGFVLKGSRSPEPQKVMDTYTEEEIRTMLSKMDRSSAIGKRNYVVVLLAASYGLRSGDITSLRFSEIDWKTSQIRIVQDKTKEPLELPLFASIGNAIINYWQNGRPTEAKDDTIIVSHMKGTIGERLKSPTIHSIVSAAFSSADIPGWREKKHGAHSLRHSLATNMLKRNVSLPIISTVLGHRSTETSKTYIGVNIDRLRVCSLQIPPIHSRFYTTGKEVCK